MLLKNNEVQEYINKVCSLIKNKDVHYDINLELQDHMQTLKEDFINSGLSEIEATKKVISNMGDPELIGQQLDKTHKAKVGWGFIMPLLGFSLFGLIAMYFIQNNLAVYEAYYVKVFQKSLIFYILGMALMTILYFFDYRKISPYSKHIYIVSVIFLISQLLFNTPTNGKYYFHFAFISIDLVLFSLILLVISLSGILQNLNLTNPYEFLKFLGIIIIPGVFMFTMSISYVFLYFVACVTLLIISKAKIYQVLLCIVTTTLGLFTYILPRPYRIYRLVALLDPASDPENSGWMYLQLKNLMNSSSAFGNWFTIKPNTIPELHTDFIFTYIVYTFGWIAAAIVIALITIFIIKLINVAKITKNYYGKLLVSGFTSILTTEFLLNIGMNFGISPIIGISLPFMSFGGSQLISNMITVGLILSVYRRKDISHNLTKSQIL
ncbi:FtsW/RodA/SpoVE family cell cycle protein [Clostridium sp.]|uniref:FtsW/RodA/SpoVE family cell cycle protein n=1 Tax=Clostridium sp. TaxID=1506 RepID=UPI00262FB0D0|nr:FtsW/RodA/SpoVE family cell cycle protein [Clostridium sp.]